MNILLMAEIKYEIQIPIAVGFVILGALLLWAYFSLSKRWKDAGLSTSEDESKSPIKEMTVSWLKRLGWFCLLGFGLVFLVTGILVPFVPVA